jgi:hypothetical protein
MKRNNPEAQIQKAVCEHFELFKAPNAELIPIPNGGKRSRVEAARMKGWGCRAGAPDLIFAHEGKGYALELKAPGGRLSAEQRQVLNALHAAKWSVSVATGIDEALNVLGSWGLLRTQRQAA